MSTMNCNQCQELIPTYLDSQLDAARIPALEQHLADCDGCAERLQEQRELIGTIRGAGIYRRAPERLRLRVQEVIRRDSPSANTARLSEARRRWALSLAAGLALAVAVDFAIVTQQRAHMRGDEIVAAHVRSLMLEHLIDVASTDQHTVKPWFAGKLDFSPPVHDLVAGGFALAGGRLDYVDGHSVAVLIYRHRQHVINLFVWPAAADGASARSHGQNGYNIVQWVSGGMNHWAVSDLNATELEYFGDQVRGAEQAPE